MNYENMSDFDINKWVAEAYGLLTQEIDDGNSLGMTTEFHEKYPSVVWVAHLDCSTGQQCEPWWQFDPCNNPSDAWPIVLENRITINPYTNPSKGWFAATDESLFADDSNPLRAACIVYLMMQEAKC